MKLVSGKFIWMFLSVIFVNFLFAVEQKHINIFKDGHLIPGAVILNGKIDSSKIVTFPLSTKPDSTFRITGLSIDISKIDLAQIHFRLIAPGDIQTKPNYAEVIVETSSGLEIKIPWFPFRAYDKNEPYYMTKSCSFADIYGEHPEGKDFGKITGFRIQADKTEKYVLNFTTMQILIDKTFTDRYPDDPMPDPNWTRGKIKDVFAISCSDRVLLNELNSPLKAGNSVWHNGKIVLEGARNETVAFQIIISAADIGEGVNNVNVRFMGVKNSTFSIDNSRAQEPDNIYNYVGRYIQLYRCRYVLYDRIDAMEGKNSPLAAQMVGKYIPEMLIPFEAKWGGAPFSIFPGQTQSIWVDIYIPQKAPAGNYRGEIEILVKGEMVKKLPVELKVYNFALPNKSSTHALIWGHVPAKHKLKGDALYEMEKTYRRFFRRNNIEMFKGIEDNELENKKAWELRSAEIFTSKNGYEGPGANLPAPIIVIKMYGGGKKPFGGPGEYGDENSWHRGLLKYWKMIKKYAPNSLAVYYAWDEPSHAFPGGIEAFKLWMNKVAPWIHSFNQKYNADIKIYATTDFEVAKEIPYLDMYAANNPHEATEMEKQGDINCRYNGPQGIMEYPSAMRIIGWQAYYFKTKIWWYWAFDSYTPGFDVYRNPYNFLNQYGELGAGTGMFVYPGTDRYIKKRNPGLPGPIPGIRFFNYRQGFIDYEYLRLAAKKDSLAVAKIVSEMVLGTKMNMGLPGVMNKISYPIGDKPYFDARRKLINIILGK